MIGRLLILLVLCVAAPTFGSSVDKAVSERAEAVLADREAELKPRAELLAQYADSLRFFDVELAAQCLQISGIAAFRTNQLDTALARWQRGVQWARAADLIQSESSLLNALAIGHTARGDVEAALPVYERALEIREALADSAGLSRTWGNLAQAYTNIGRTAEALVAIAEEEKWLALVDNPTGQVANAIRRAQLLADMGRYDEALLQSRVAADLAVEFGDENAQGLSAMTMGHALLDLGRYDEALIVLTDAATRLRETGDDYSATFAEQSTIDCQIRLGQSHEALVQVRALAEEVEAAGELPLLTVLRRYEGNALFALGRTAEAEIALVQALKLFEDRRASLSDDRSRSGIFKASGEIYASLARCQLVANRPAQAFATVERGRAATFRDKLAGVGADTCAEASLVELQEHLGKTQGALILFNDPVLDPLVAFVLDAKGLKVVTLGSVGPMAADARAAMRLLAAGESLATCEPALVRLEETLSGPILAAIDPAVNRFSVVPPAFLAGFPLGILRDKEGYQWSEKRPLSYLPNASAMLALDQREVPSAGILALADPVVPSGLLDRLPLSSARSQAGVPLPEARAEIAIIAMKQRQRRVGAAASGQALREALSSPLAVLHLATHAVVDPIDGGRSAIVLAGPDGVDAVTAQEIASFDFPGDLVVLSGCSTFGNHRVLGEGWFGLPRSFLVAGARTVVSTLWDVDDSGARQFVTAFYVALRHGAARDEALVQARTVCREAGMPPREWAAFVLTGVGSDGVELLAQGSPLRRLGLVWVLALILAGGGILIWFARR